MIKNYLRVALRNIRNYKAFSLINIIGLAVGIACCIAIMLYVRDEISYDRFNKDADRIYRPILHGRINGHDVDIAMSPATMGHRFPMIYPMLKLMSASSRLVFL